MTISTQVDLIAKGNMIEDRGEADARLVFRATAKRFRKWMSPVLQPAGTWFDNVDRIKKLCRLDGDERVDVEMLAMRAAACIGATVQPGLLDELAEAAGLDRVGNSETSIGFDDANARIEIRTGDADAEDGAFVIVMTGHSLVIRGSSREGLLETDDRLTAANSIDHLAVRDAGGAKNIEIDYGPAPAYDGEIFDAVHDPWRPTKVYSERLKAHPTKIIEPATLAATPYPPATYRPLLPADAINRGLISDVQYETIVYALQATEQYLPGSVNGARHARAPRAGFIIGDGTGVGKTNEAVGIILDQWNRESRRHIIVVEREKHHVHIQEAWVALGGKPRDIVWHGSYDSREPLPDRDAVIVTSYALIRNDLRYQSLIDWAKERGMFTGCLIFDEAHNMRNAIEDKAVENAGPKNQSQQGMRGVEIQDDLPDARVVYMSATMATDVYNLGYAPRLGLWGHGAPFSSVDHFIGEMHKLDQAALEQVCIDLKAAGRYCSRNLSFDGVEYDEIEHRLTPAQRDRFNQLVRSWKTLQDMRKACQQAAGGAMVHGKKVLPGQENHRGSSRQKRLMIEQLLANFNTDSLIEDVHRQIAEGNAPVIQIAFTGAALLERMAEGRDFVPVDEYYDKSLENWVMDNFPVTRMKLEKHRWVEETDAAGNPIPIPGAMAIRDDALAVARGMAPRQSALDKLYLAFGDDIAEMTGRGIRALPVRKNGQLTGWRIEERSPNDAVTDVMSFSAGRKRILVFSLGAGGTGLSYHAARGIENRARRVHYILELGQRAEQSVQGIGRTHRSGQIIAPIVKLVRCDLPAHTIYASRTLEKIAKMGALSRGHQHATTNAIFDQRVPLSGIYAQRGWTRTIADIRNGDLEGFTTAGLAKDLEMPETKRESGISMENFSSVVMRLATLTDGDQRTLIERFTKNVEEEVSSAIRQGTYNQGLETIRGDSIEIVDENTIVNANGSETRYIRLRKKEEVELLPFRRVVGTYSAIRSKRNSNAVFVKHKVNGRIVMAAMKDGPAGIVDVYSPGGMTTRTREMLREEPWKIIDDLLEAQRLWELESETMDVNGVIDIHILSGSLLYNWNKLPQSGSIGLNRCRTDDGRVVVGRLVPANDLRQTLQSLGMKSNYRPTQIASFLSKVVQGASIDIDNGWRIVAPATTGGNFVLLIPDDQQTGKRRRDLMDAGVLVHDTPLGYDLEIPRSEAIEVIQHLAIGCELTLSGTTSTVTAAAAMVSAPAPISALPLAAAK